MNKTIINGIDVSECEFYAETRKLPDNLNGGYYIEHYYCDLQGDNYCICNKNPNCYFKKFKRLQEENEELKEKVNSYNCNANCYKYEQAEKYKQALEEIRENILSKYDIDKNKEIIARPLEDLWCIKKLIDEVLNDRD